MAIARGPAGHRSNGGRWRVVAFAQLRVFFPLLFPLLLNHLYSLLIYIYSQIFLVLHFLSPLFGPTVGDSEEQPRGASLPAGVNPPQAQV